MSNHFPGSRRRGRVLVAAFVLLLLLFAFVLHHVFSLRMDYGDVFPNYSSYRADPMGAQAFYEALTALPGLRVERNEKAIERLTEGKDTTLFLAGVLDTDDPKYVISAIEGFVLGGGRLIVTYLPMNGQYWEQQRERKKREKLSEAKQKDESGEKEQDAKEDGDKCKNGDCPVNISEEWGFSLKGKALPGEKDNDTLGFAQVQRKDTAGTLPETLSWRSSTYFSELAEHWKVIYARHDPLPNPGDKPAEELPVVIERTLGQGSIVVAADSYFLSNEAMRKHRAPGFLAWLLGSNSHIIFDESHNGIARDTNVVDLIKRYRLQGVLLALALTALVFVWGNASTLVPRHGADYEETLADEESGKEALAGLNNLVRRSVPPGRLIEECYLAWRQDLGRDRRFPQEKLDAVEAVARDNSANAPALVARYRLISKLLKERI